MPHNLCDHIFERHIYVTREVDQKLGVILESFLRGSRPMRWISLRSLKGRGNTLILERIRRLKADHTHQDTLRIFVPGASSSSPALNPLAAELHALHLSAQKGFRGWLRSKVRDLRSRVQNSSGQQIFANVLVVAGCLMVTCILKGLEQYVTSSAGQVTTLYGWRTFFFTYLPSNWDRLPVWFLVGSSVGFPLSVATVYMTRNGLLPAPPSATTPTKTQIAELNSLAGLKKALFDLFAKKRRVLLLVDDADQLPPIEQDFLRRLFVPEVKDDFARKGWVILIVTVDRTAVNRKEILNEHMQGSFEALEVPPFQLVDLKAIVDSQLPADEMPDAEDGLAVLEQARNDINALFARQDQDLIEKMGQKFQDNDIEGEFTPSKLLLYRIVKRDRWISKTSLTKWLNLFQTEPQLQIFQLTKSESDQGLVFSLGKSNLVNRQGETLVFETSQMEALTQWIKQNNRLLLAQAHYYWFKNSLNQVSAVAAPPFDVGSLTDEERQHLRRGTWHALQLNNLKAVPELLADRPNLNDDERRKLQLEASAFLVPAIALLRREGDFVKADTLAGNALDWVRTSDAPERDALLDRLADHLWRNFLLSGDPLAQRWLQTLSEDLPDLTKKPFWKTYRAFDELRKGVVSGDIPTESELSESHHQNLHRLTATLIKIRQSHGFLSAALVDKELTIPEPVESVADFAEFELRQLKSAALIQRGEIEGMITALQEWRGRLLETKVADELLGENALYAYWKARYWHQLSDVSRLGVKGKKAQPESERQASREELDVQLRALSLIPLTQDQPLSVTLTSEAENSYGEARQLALLLDWRSLLMEASFHLGVLLEANEPQDTEPEKWQWDKLFTQVTQLEEELGWLVHTPRAHKIRWERVYKLDRELSIEDAYNVYQTLKRANYPVAVLVEWHRRTSTLLNDYGQDENDRRRSAEFYETWASNFATKPEAAGFLDYEDAGYEQASALILAAQAWRLLKNFERTEELLNQAESFLHRGSKESGAEDPSFRTLHIRLQIQRAWVLDAKQKKPQYENMIRAIWRDLRLEDSAVPLVLGSLFSIENSAGTLKKAWPSSPNLSPHVDPENEHLSLPPVWFEGSNPLEIKTVFEFRFRQLLRLIDESPNPAADRLKWAAFQQWFGREKFGEIALEFAEAASSYAPHLEPLTVSLLEAVRAYFSTIEGVDRTELESLRLLMQYPTMARRYRAEYIKVLVEFEGLTERERRMLQLSEWSNWSTMAIWASKYLGLLVDQSLIRMDLAKNNQSVEQVGERQQQMRPALESAQEKYFAGDFASCLRELRKILARPMLAFVIIEDIVALDLWIKCKHKVSDTRTDEFNERATQLRKTVMQYVKQLGAIIPESQAQILALNILSDLQLAEARIQA